MSNLIAHRGLDNIKYKENTKDAILDSLSKDYIKGIEIDVRMTKDNKFVLVHDMIINRVSNGSGFVKNMTLKQLKKYNFGTKEKPCKITTLKEILKTIPSDKIVLIEIKNSGDDIDKYVKYFLREIRFFFRKNIYVMSFNEEIMKKIKKFSKKVKCGLLISTIINSSHLNDNYDFIAISSYSVKKVKNYKKPIFVWAINNKKRYFELKKDMPTSTYYIVDIPSNFL